MLLVLLWPDIDSNIDIPGMLLGEQGYQPEPFYLTSALRNQSRFHDPFGDSLFAYSGSVTDWRTHRSGSATPTSPSHHSPKHNDLASASTLLVRSTRPILLPDEAPSPSIKVVDGVFETKLPTLITPPSSTDKRIRYVILEVSQLCKFIQQPSELRKRGSTFSGNQFLIAGKIVRCIKLNSRVSIFNRSNLEAEDWIRMATEIEMNYSNFDSFIILHGTDTLWLDIIHLVKHRPPDSTHVATPRVR